MVNRDQTEGKGRFSVGAAALMYFATWVVVAYALPGFEEAPYRSRVARSKTEFRNLAVSLESYYDDHRVYPPGNPHIGLISDAISLVPTYAADFPHEIDYHLLHLQEKFNRILSLLAVVLTVILTVLLIGLAKARGLGRVIGLACIGVFNVVFFAAYSAYPHSLLTPVVALLPLAPVSIYGFLRACDPFLAMRKGTNGKLLREILLDLYPVGAFFSLLAVVFAGCVYKLYQSSNHSVTSYCYATDGSTSWVLTSSGPDTEHDINLAGLFIDSPTESRKGLPKTEVLLERLQPLEYDPTNGTTSRGDVFRVGP